MAAQKEGAEWGPIQGQAPVNGHENQGMYYRDHKEGVGGGRQDGHRQRKLKSLYEDYSRLFVWQG